MNRKLILVMVLVLSLSRPCRSRPRDSQPHWSAAIAQVIRTATPRVSETFLTAPPVIIRIRRLQSADRSYNRGLGPIEDYRDG